MDALLETVVQPEENRHLQKYQETAAQLSERVDSVPAIQLLLGGAHGGEIVLVLLTDFLHLRRQLLHSLLHFAAGDRLPPANRKHPQSHDYRQKDNADAVGRNDLVQK